ncbi:MAG: AAA family ATPase [Patescibacteria group bacterium]|nr:AAA family ATPase [Patescibacteria group bacterium]
MPKQKFIVGLTGEKLAGKGTTAAYLAEKYNAVVFRFSQILDEVLKKLYLPITRENEIKLGLSLRQNFGDDILAKTLFQDVKDEKADLIIVDGMRFREEAEMFSQLDNFILVYITAPIKIRFERMKNRTEKADEKNMDFNKFKEIEDISPTETVIKATAQKAKVKIENIGTFEELYAKIEKEIMKKYYF